jgi:hypothetical protein
MWKIFQKGKEDKFWVVDVDRPDFSFEWILDRYGEPRTKYYDKQKSEMIDIAVIECKSGEEAKQVINDIELRKNCFYFDVTKEYL